MAKLGGFDKPILHGLCTLGISVRLVLKAYGGYDTSSFRALKARFTKPSIPGQTLRVSMWREGNRIYFETSIAETNTVVVSGKWIFKKNLSLLCPNTLNWYRFVVFDRLVSIPNKNTKSLSHGLILNFFSCVFCDSFA